MNRISITLAALAVATVAHAAVAQGSAASGIPSSTSTTAAAGASSTNGAQPQAVGVSPQAASAAQRKAVPRSDTATVVRTGPSAADKASRITDRTSTHRVRDTGSRAGSARAAASGAVPTGYLPPRADRH